MRLPSQLEIWIAPSTGSPDRAHDDLAFVEGVVEVAGQLSEVEATQVGDARRGVGRPRSGEDRKDPESVLK